MPPDPRSRRGSPVALVTSALAPRAIEAGALADAPRADGLAAAGAGLAGAAIDPQRAGEVAGVAVFLHEVPQTGAALGDGGGEHGLDARGETFIARQRDAPGGPRGMDAGAVQGLAGVDVADADDDMAVHDEGLDR